MKWGFPAALFGGIVMQLLACGGLAYRAGYSGAISLLAVSSLGVLVGICVAVGIVRALGVRGVGKSHVALLVIILVAGFFGRPFVLSMFASGFEKRALQQASVKEWESLLSIADQLASLESKDRASVLPKFVGRVFPERTPYMAATQDSEEDASASLSLWWRNAGVCAGFDIGRNQPPRPRLIFRRELSEQVAVVVFPDS